MENKFIPEGIKTVNLAIEKDNAKEYAEAYTLYKKALDYFMTGLKYERNPASKDIILKRVEGYMARAEQLKEQIDNPQPEQKKAAPASGGGKEGDKKEDDDKSKLRGALSGAIVKETPNVKWDDVAGLYAAKDALKEAVILPAQFPQLFTGKRKPWKGILLYGPPGTGKSYLAKAVATEAKSTFFAVSSSDLVSKWQGESERLVKQLFEMAREEKPAIVFIDEIDSLCGSRSEGENDSARRIKTEFLVQMQGVGSNQDGVLVLGATNVPWELDPAMRRRFEKRIYIPLPDADARERMLRIHFGDTPNQLTDADWKEISRRCDGCSGSDMSVVVREALMYPIRHCQSAKQWIRLQPNDPRNTIQADGGYFPCMQYPNCHLCPPELKSTPGQLQSMGIQAPNPSQACSNCFAVRLSIFDVPSELLVPPKVTMADFSKVLEHAASSVGEDELERFVEWTKEFGQEG